MSIRIGKTHRDHRQSRIARRLAVCFLLILSALLVSFADAARVVKVGVNANMKPFQFVGPDGKLSGLHVDLFDKLAQNKGWSVYYIVYDDNAKCYEALEKGEIDLILGARMGDSRAASFLTSDEMSKSSICIISKNVEEIGNHFTSIAAVEFGTVNFYTLYQLGIKSYFVCRDQNQIYSSITEGTLSLAVGVEDMLMYRLTEDGLADDYTIQKHFLAPISYAIISRKSDIELQSSVNSGLSELRTSGAYEKIYNSWIRDYDMIQAAKIFRQVLIIAGLVSIIALSYIIVNRRINKTLKLKIEEKTRDLHEANLQLEEKIQQIEKESLLRGRIINASPNAIVIFDMTGTILVSNVASHILSRTDSSLNGANILDLEIFNEIILFECPDRQLSKLRDVSTPIFYETWSRGHKENFRYTIYRIETTEKVPAVMISINDITEEEKERQQSFESEKNLQLNRLVAGIAHEIKNPLSTIRTATSLMINQEDDPEVKDAFRRLVPAEIERILFLVDGLKNYARPVKGNPEVFSLSETLDDCVNLAQISVIRAKGIVVHEVQKNLMIYGRKDQLTQCFMNLILNGAEAIERKYARSETAITEKPKLTIRASSENGEITVLIADEGVGMSQQELSHLGEPFYTTKTVGTGLGLVMTFQFTKDNGGTVEIQSEKGIGTQVILRFPETA